MPVSEPGWWAAAIAAVSAVAGYVSAVIKRRVDTQTDLIAMRGEMQALRRDLERHHARLSALETGSVGTASALSAIAAQIESIGRTLGRLETKLDGKADR